MNIATKLEVIARQQRNDKASARRKAVRAIESVLVNPMLAKTPARERAELIIAALKSAGVGLENAWN